MRAPRPAVFCGVALALVAALGGSTFLASESGAEQTNSRPNSAAAPDSGFEPSSKSLGKPDVIVTGQVGGEQTFERDIGRGLVFRLVRSPESFGKGWDIQLVPKDPAGGYPDYAVIATPPYHLYKPTFVNASYGVTAKQAVAMTPRHFQFVETPADSQRATVVVQTMVYAIDWRLEENQLRQQAAKIPVGVGELRILRSRITNGSNREDLGSVDALKFEARFWLAPPVTLKDVLFPDSAAAP